METFVVFLRHKKGKIEDETRASWLNIKVQTILVISLVESEVTVQNNVIIVFI